jgi:hypothetical protein
MLPCQEDNRSFFEKLQKAEGLDLRDNRGKRHDLAVVLVGARDGYFESPRRLFIKYSSAFEESLQENNFSFGG